MFKRVFFLFLIAAYGKSIAQDAEAFNKIYNTTYLETAQKDFNKALKTADSLYTISTNPNFKVKSLMLSASLYQQSGDVKKSVHYALESEKILAESDNANWKARVYGFLATQYRLLKLYTKSKEYSYKALKAAEQIENPELSNNTNGFMWQELAYYEMEFGHYKKAISYIEKSKQYFKTSRDKEYFDFQNEQLLGENYFSLKNNDEALKHYEIALKYSEKYPENYVHGLVYNGLSAVYMEKGDLELSKKYLTKAEKIAEKSEYLELKSEVYKTSEKYYTKIKDLKAVETVQNKKDTLEEEIVTKKAQFLNESFTSLDKEKREAENESTKKGYIIIVIGILLIACIIVFIIYRKKHKENLERFRRVLESLKNRNAAEFNDKKDLPQEVSNISEFSNLEKNSLMTEETEQKILFKLEKFEKSDLFIKPSISLPFLAGYFGTNTKYLSHIIKTYRKKDFNNYINSLRINYIIDKLNNNPVYRQYKIAVLAEEAGFSSQAKFSTIFKNVTTFSPSVFIHYLNERETSESL